MSDSLVAIIMIILGIILLEKADKIDDKGKDGSLWAFIAVCMFIGSCSKF